MSFARTFWPVVGALIVLSWLHPLTPVVALETAYFLPEGHKGQDDYLGFVRMSYSADRVTQTVVTYTGDSPQAQSQCTVLSAVTWQCEGIGSDDGEVWIGLFGRSARQSVGRTRYFMAWLLQR